MKEKIIAILPILFITINGFGQEREHEHDQIEFYFESKSLAQFQKNLTLTQDQKNDEEVFHFINREYQDFFQITLNKLRTQPHYTKEKFNAEYTQFIETVKTELPKGNGNKSPITPKVINGPCTNIDFENGNLTGWELTRGDVNGLSSYSYVNETPASPSAFHQIMGNGVDPVTGIPTNNPMGGNFSVRLGDGTGIGAKGARMKQTFLVDSSNYLFTYSYAVIFESPSDHTIPELPYFTVRVFDSNGQSVPCGEYSVIADPITAQNYQATTYNGKVVLYKNWETVFTNLSSYIGQNIQIEFTSGDCSKTGHYGYCYVDANCSVDRITASNHLICTGDSAILTAPAGASNYQWSNGANTQSITVFTGGTYSCTITPFQGSGCSVTLDIIINEQPSPFADFISNTTQICAEDSVYFTNQSTAPPPTSLLSYRWDFGDGQISPIGNGLNINTPKTTGSYQTPAHFYTVGGTYNVELLAIADNGCRDSIVFPIQVLVLPPVVATPDTTLCNGENVTLSGSGAISYSWNNGISNGVQFQPTLGQTSYRVIGTDANGCRDTAFSLVTVNPLPLVEAGPNQAGCENDIITLTATLGGNYIWSNGIPNGGSFQQNVGTQTYTVQAELNNCYSYDSLTVTIHPSTEVTAGNDQEICADAVAALSATTVNGINPVWFGGTGTFSTPNANSCNYTPSAQEIYQGWSKVYFQATNPNGCPSAIDSLMITINHFVSSLTVSTTDITCFGYNDGIAQLNINNPNNAPFTYLLDNTTSSNTPNFDQLSPGIHILKITNALGCDTIIQFSIFEPTKVNIVIEDLVNIDCFGNNTGFLSANSSGGTGTRVYSWSNGENGSYIDSLFAGLYQVNVTDQNGCTNQLDTLLTEPQPLTLQTVSNPIMCNGDTTNIGSQIQGGTAPYQILWSNGNTTFSIMEIAGTYSCEVKDLHQCNEADTIVVAEPLPLSISISKDTTVCANSPVGIDVLVSGGASPYNYTWPNGNNQNSSPILASFATTTPLTSTVIDKNGCEIQATVLINIFKKLEDDYLLEVTNTELCENDSIVADIKYTGNTPIEALRWLDCDSCLFPRTFFPTSDTILYTELISQCNDTLRDQIYIDIIERPELDIMFETPLICPNTSYTLFTNSINPQDWALTWELGNGKIKNGNTAIVSYPTPGDYIINLTAVHFSGCIYKGEYSDTLRVLHSANADFKVNGYEKSIFDPVFQFTNLSTNAVEYIWDFNDGAKSYLQHPTHTYSTFGEFDVQLIAISENGCSDTIEKAVVVKPDYNIYAPNTFTPDFNRFNQNFRLKGFGISEEGFHLMIFNRWGELIFEGFSITDEWEGTTNNGEIAPDGAYPWKVQFKTLQGELKYKVGHVNLLR
ncbi:MAG: PKD domain-containing protein [Bacteroidetes bacterium]|nr:PKD domain-containing protein [Bacteroidota bacterium]